MYSALQQFFNHLLHFQGPGIAGDFILLITFLISLVGFLIIIVNYTLTDNSRGVILDGISGNISGLQKLSEHEFSSFKNIVNEGIVETSGLLAVENIVSIVLRHQKEFHDTVQFFHLFVQLI